MDIVVCMKQIPNPDLQFQIAPDGRDIKREALNYRTNGADEYALEAAVQLKEKHGGTVVAVTVGPQRTEQMLREAMAKGADDAIRVAYEDPAAWDAMKVARILAATIRTTPYDLILAGVQSDDYVYSQTGGLIAAHLDVPHASVVTAIDGGESEIVVHRELEGGDEEVVALALPALLTIQFGINQPRYAPLPAIMKAARRPIRVVTPQDLGKGSWDDFVEGYELTVRALRPPQAQGHAEFVSGSLEEQAKAVAKLLRDKGFFRG
jgi:electron transfer flavoprotein beta subunit